MASAWDQAAGIAELTGLDATRLIGMIVQAANRARLHKRNCRQFAKLLKVIGNLLQPLNISELMKYPETREPLEELEDALRRAYLLVNSCQKRSYFYRFTMGWNIVDRFRQAQNEIDQYLKIIPLIILFDNARVRHVPKTNGEIPSVDEATLDHQRLLERLQLYGLVEHKVQGDGNCQGEPEQLQPPFFLHDWPEQSIQNHASGQEEAEAILHSSSCPSPDEEACCREDWPYPLELPDEYAYDGELGRRLNQMICVPHVPKTNGEIPSVDEATLDRQRLLERLQLYDLVERKVQGDGNCQFRALSDQIYRTAEHHDFIRQDIVKQLKSCPEIYEGYVSMAYDVAYDDYLEKMSKTGEWGVIMSHCRLLQTRLASKYLS